MTIPAAVVAELPRFVEPELATLVRTPPEGDGRLHEIKHHGYRMAARVDGGRCSSSSRRAHDWAPRFRPSQRPWASCRCGRRVSTARSAPCGPDGRSEINALQNAAERAGRIDVPPVFYLFDVLGLDGMSLMPARIEDRKTARRGSPSTRTRTC